MSAHRPLYHLLLVEDNGALAASAAAYLTRRGLHVDVIGNVEQAFASLAGEPYDAIITDLDLSGTAASARPRPTILFWTGPSGLVREEARRLGADDVLEKPGLAELAHALASHLGTPHALAAVGGV